MNDHKEHLWQAYLDGELSASEAAQFESSLSDIERAQLAEDMRFERVLAERLSEDAECPDDVWARTRALVEGRGSGAAPALGRSGSWRLGAATLAAAASIAFLLSQYVPLGGAPESSAVILAASTIEELAAGSEVEQGPDSAERFLHGHGIDLGIVDDTTAVGRHRNVEVVGARQELLCGEMVTEVLIGCCGFPLKILLTKRDSAVAREIGLAAANNSDVQSTRIVGDYLVAVVGHHKSHSLLEMFAE